MFSERLTLILKQKDITQLQLAQELGITQQAVNRWCKKITQPDNDTIVKIAKYLKVSTDFLLGNDENYDNNVAILKEKEVLRNFLINIDFIKADEILSDNDINNLIEFININKKYIKIKK